MRQRKLSQQRLGLVEVGIALSGESHDDIGSNRRMRHHRADPVDEVPVRRRGVRPSHSTQHIVGAVLEWQVKMRRETRRLGNEIDDVLRAIHRLQRTDAEQHICVPFSEMAHERRQRGAIVKISAVRAEMNARDDDFFIARRDDVRELTRDLGEGSERLCPRVVGMMQ
jgi:hypothetical protein